MNAEELQWEEKERAEIVSRMLALRDDQIGALIGLAGPGFYKEDIEDIVKEFRAEGEQAGNLEIFLTEATSKEDLLWWLDYFERANRKRKRLFSKN
ncbi:MAG: hypothetical protein HYS89_00985 [Candidatus Colwellbacteria bacterium]|nr:hypothetical protein [Candidatus Colwellbacteria bacterium]